MTNPIRVATAAISGRIFAGRPTKDGLGFKEPRYDVTGDVFRAIRDFVGVGNEIEVGLPGAAVEFRIAIFPPIDAPKPVISGDAASGEERTFDGIPISALAAGGQYHPGDEA